MNVRAHLPTPLFGDGNGAEKMFARPSIPITFASPLPDGVNNTNYDAGIADILFPLLVVPPVENKGIIFGLGPTLVLPTSSKVQLGRRQWQLGPAAVVGYKTKDYVVGVFPQYFWGVGGRGDQGSNIENASNMNLLYFGFLNLPKAWQVGMNPVITYDNKASRGNKWNVPIGLVVAKTTKIGKMPVKFIGEVNYSVIRPDDYGTEWKFIFRIAPVIPSPFS